ncbi:hypothetical protein FRB98_000907 [Tulasnella sp. 332]|nr:hypothetical protein FRB98_000907 [Tulasnella sp. 332]
MPTGTIVPRPRRLPLSISAFADFPRRLLNPPPAPCQARSLKISPDFQVELDGILGESALDRLRKSGYFVVWLKDYTRAFDAYTSMPAEPPEARAIAAGKLALLHARALATFFDTSSHLALNLPHTIVVPVRDVAEQSFLSPPEALSEAHEYVREMLKESLKRFLKSSYGNSDTNRSWFAWASGWIVASAVVGVTVLGIFWGWPRATRLASYPILILAISTIFASAHGVCLAIFTFADSRQLRPFELAAPRFSDAVSRPSPSTSNKEQNPLDTPRSLAYDSIKLGSPNSFAAAPDLEEGTATTVRYKPDSLKRIVDEQRTSTTDDPQSSISDDKTKYLYTASFIPVASTSRSITATATASETTHINEPGSPFIFDFDALPSFYPIPSTDDAPSKPFSFHSRRSRSVRSMDIKSMTTDLHGATVLSHSSPVFAELAKVSDPIVVRSQWEIFSRSLLYGTSVATLIMVALMAAPYPPGARN